MTTKPSIFALSLLSACNSLYLRDGGDEAATSSGPGSGASTTAPGTSEADPLTTTGSTGGLTTEGLDTTTSATTLAATTSTGETSETTETSETSETTMTDKPPQTRLVFVTSEKFNGTMQSLSDWHLSEPGIAGADAHCQKLGARPDKVFKAWISDGTDEPSERLEGSEEFQARELVRVDGAVVADNWDDFVNHWDLDGHELNNPISVTETGKELDSDFLFWSGVNADGTRSDGPDCAAWSAPKGNASVGDASKNGREWSNIDWKPSCDDQLRLVCIETEDEP